QFQFVGNRTNGSATTELTGALTLNGLGNNLTMTDGGGGTDTASITFGDLILGSGASGNFDLASGVDLKFAKVAGITPTNGQSLPAAISLNGGNDVGSLAVSGGVGTVTIASYNN